MGCPPTIFVDVRQFIEVFQNLDIERWAEGTSNRYEKSKKARSLLREKRAFDKLIVVAGAIAKECRNIQLIIVSLISEWSQVHITLVGLLLRLALAFTL